MKLLARFLADEAGATAIEYGLIAALIVLVLLCISNNASIRRLRAATWKSIQKWNYVGAILVIVHGLLYQALEERMSAFVACVLVVTAMTAIVQLLGFRRRRGQLMQEGQGESSANDLA